MNEDSLDFNLDLSDYTKERDKEELPLDLPQSKSESIIKVVGVGGGGGNAVNHMYNEGIHDVTFAVCNTDKKDLQDSPVPYKLQFGEGLGAGNNPQKGKEEAEKCLPEIKKMFEDGTKMVFITAGMGGGTGTGAAPVVARVAKQLDILTVGIVTIPFKWEGASKIDQALDGVDELRKNVDSMLVINNQRLLELYPDKSMEDCFDISDDTLCNAAKSISEIITMHGKVGMDYQDVKTVLKDGGVAIMSTGYGQGESRVAQAIENALHSPLLNNRDVFKSKKILLNIVEPGKNGDKPLMMEEMSEIQDFMSKMVDDNIQTKWGFSYDPSLKDRVKITILASGFGMADINSDEMAARIEEKNEEEIRREAKNRARREKTYGADSKNGLAYVPINYYIFKDRDLDNDNLISSVVSVPTSGRKKSQLDQLENISNGVIPTTE
ncbi:MAG: cell division protein FtsZ [Bacteroidaceae bacterium]|nr:cell division protein FtsZ [Bacteroidaceae bacterium]